MGANPKTQSCIFRCIASFVLVCFTATMIAPQRSYAQNFILPAPGGLVSLSPHAPAVVLRGLQVYPQNPFEFNFLVDFQKDSFHQEQSREQVERLIRYFLSALTTPEKDLWVNLSPYEQGRIVPAQLGVTELGRDMLAQDYLLKQVTSSLMYPENDLGARFWDMIYQRAYEKYGQTNIPVDVFNKVWIIPAKAVVYEEEDKAIVAKADLKVLLDKEYLAGRDGQNKKIQTGQKLFSDDSSLQEEVIKEIIIPEIEKEVNFGKSFAKLRQIYHAIILSYWFKHKLQKALLNKIYADQSKIKGIDLSDQATVDYIYGQYVEAFKKGAFNVIKEVYDPSQRSLIPRKYFSGGAQFDERHLAQSTEFTKDKAVLTSLNLPAHNIQQAHVGLESAGAKAAGVAQSRIPQSLDSFETSYAESFKELDNIENMNTQDIKNIMRRLNELYQKVLKTQDSVSYEEQIQKYHKDNMDLLTVLVYLQNSSALNQMRLKKYAQKVLKSWAADIASFKDQKVTSEEVGRFDERRLVVLKQEITSLNQELVKAAFQRDKDNIREIMSSKIRGYVRFLVNTNQMNNLKGLQKTVKAADMIQSRILPSAGKKAALQKSDILRFVNNVLKGYALPVTDRSQAQMRRALTESAVAYDQAMVARKNMVNNFIQGLESQEDKYQKALTEFYRVDEKDFNSVRGAFEAFQGTHQSLVKEARGFMKRKNRGTHLYEIMDTYVSALEKKYEEIHDLTVVYENLIWARDHKGVVDPKSKRLNDNEAKTVWDRWWYTNNSELDELKNLKKLETEILQKKDGREDDVSGEDIGDVRARMKKLCWDRLSRKMWESSGYNAVRLKESIYNYLTEQDRDVSGNFSQLLGLNNASNAEKKKFVQFAAWSSENKVFSREDQKAIDAAVEDYLAADLRAIRNTKIIRRAALAMAFTLTLAVGAYQMNLRTSDKEQKVGMEKSNDQKSSEQKASQKEFGKNQTPVKIETDNTTFNMADYESVLTEELIESLSSAGLEEFALQDIEGQREKMKAIQREIEERKNALKSLQEQKTQQERILRQKQNEELEKQKALQEKMKKLKEKYNPEPERKDRDGPELDISLRPSSKEKDKMEFKTPEEENKPFQNNSDLNDLKGKRRAQEFKNAKQPVLDTKGKKRRVSRSVRDRYDKEKVSTGDYESLKAYGGVNGSGGGYMQVKDPVMRNYTKEGHSYHIDFDKGVIRSSKLAYWEPVEIFPEIGDRIDEFIVIEEGKEEQVVNLPPGYRILNVQTTKDVPGVFVYYDKENGLWSVRFSETGNSGVNPGQVKVQIGLNVKENFPQPLKIVPEGQDAKKIRSFLPEKVLQIVDYAKDLSEQEKDEYIQRILKLFFYTTNPLFKDAQYQGGNELQTMFKYYGANCDGLSMIYASLAYLLDVPAVIEYGDGRVIDGEGNVVSTAKHMWVRKGKNMRLFEATQGLSGYSPLTDKTDVEPGAWEEEMRLLSDQDRKDFIEQSLDNMAQEIRLKHQDARIQKNIQKNREQQNIVEKKKKDIFYVEKRQVPELYQKKQNEYAQKTESIKENVNTFGNIAAIAQNMSWQKTFESQSPYPAMLFADYQLTILEILQQKLIDNRQSFVLENGFSAYRSVYIQVNRLKEQGVAWLEQALEKTENQDIEEPVQGLTFSGTETRLRHNFYNEYHDYYRPLETQSLYRFAVQTSGREATWQDIYTGENYHYRLQEGESVNSAFYHFCLVRAEGNYLKVIDTKTKEIVYEGSVAGEWKARLTHFISLPLVNNEWMITIDEKVYGPAAQRMGCEGRVLDDLFVLGNDVLLLTGDGKIKNEEYAYHGSIASKLGIEGKTLKKVMIPIKAANGDYVFWYLDEGTFHYVTMIPKEDGGYSIDVESEPAVDCFGLKKMMSKYHWSGIPESSLAIKTSDGYWRFPQTVIKRYPQSNLKDVTLKSKDEDDIVQRFTVNESPSFLDLRFGGGNYLNASFWEEQDIYTKNESGELIQWEKIKNLKREMEQVFLVDKENKEWFGYVYHIDQTKSSQKPYLKYNQDARFDGGRKYFIDTYFVFGSEAIMDNYYGVILGLLKDREGPSLSPYETSIYYDAQGRWMVSNRGWSFGPIVEEILAKDFDPVYIDGHPVIRNVTFTFEREENNSELIVPGKYIYEERIGNKKTLGGPLYTESGLKEDPSRIFTLGNGGLFFESFNVETKSLDTYAFKQGVTFQDKVDAKTLLTDGARPDVFLARWIERKVNDYEIMNGTSLYNMDNGHVFKTDLANNLQHLMDLFRDVDSRNFAQTNFDSMLEMLFLDSLSAPANSLYDFRLSFQDVCNQIPGFVSFLLEYQYGTTVFEIVSQQEIQPLDIMSSGQWEEVKTSFLKDKRLESGIGNILPSAEWEAAHYNKTRELTEILKTSGDTLSESIELYNDTLSAYQAELQKTYAQTGFDYSSLENYFTALHHALDSEFPFYVEMSDSVKALPLYKITETLRESQRELHVSGTFNAEKLRKWQETNQKLKEILPEDFHGNQEIESVEALIKQLTDQWGFWYVMSVVLGLLGGWGNAVMKRRGKFLDGRMTSKEMIREVLANNSWLDAKGEGDQRGIMEVVEKIMRIGEDMTEQDKQQLEKVKNGLDEKGQAIIDAVMLMALDIPQDSYKIKLNKILLTFVPVLSGFLIRDRKKFQQWESFNRKISDFVLSRESKRSLSDFYQKLIKLAREYGQVKVEKAQKTNQDEPLLSPEEFRKTYTNLVLNTRRVIRTEKALMLDQTNGMTDKFRRGKSMEFHDVKEYQEGDDIRRMEWNKTASRGRPMVKTFEKDELAPADFVIDLRFIHEQGAEKWLREMTDAMKAVYAQNSLGADKGKTYTVKNIFVIDREGNSHRVWTTKGNQIKFPGLLKVFQDRVMTFYEDYYQKEFQSGLQKYIMENLTIYDAGENARYRDQVRDSLKDPNLFSPKQNWQNALALLGRNIKSSNVFLVGNRDYNIQKAAPSAKIFVMEDSHAVILERPREKDEAMSVSGTAENFSENTVQSADNLGGIDFNLDNADFSIQGSGMKFNIPQNYQNQSLDNIQGFVPVIINITPISNIFTLVKKD